MATIMSLFSRKVSDPVRSQQEPSPRDETLIVRDSASFEQMGESQQVINGGIDSVTKSLEAISGLAKQLSDLKKELARSFDAHRKLALSTAVLEQDRAHVRQGLTEKTAQFDAVTAELRTLRETHEEVSRGFEKARWDLDVLNNKYHLLGVANKEVEESLQNAQSQLSAANDGAEGLRSEIAALKALNDSSTARISDLLEKYNDANSKNVFLTNRVESLESALQEKTADILGLRELHDLVCQERDSAVIYARQREHEATQSRNETAKLAQINQQERKAREIETGQLRAELDTVRANLKAHEAIGAATRIENDKLVVEVKRLEDRCKTLEAATARNEAQAARLSAKLESTLTAKSQIEQSRTVISARLEVLTQALGEREDDVKRLESELETQAIRAERQNAIAQDSVDALQARIFELEKDVASKQNEVAFYTSQLETVNRYELKAG